MTVCINGTCPFEDCSYHPVKLKGMPRDGTVTVMRLDAVCRRYIGWLADEIGSEKQHENRPDRR